MSPSNGSISANVSNGNRNYIEHPVSKMDTLAGVAIKYGVEVADIKRLNGLATDLQMFALKTLQIPLPGRHPPSPIVPNGSSSPGENSIEKTPKRLGYSDVLESIESFGTRSPQEKFSPASTATKKKVSPAMSTLQKYYGLRYADRKGASEGMEMSVYRSRSSDCFDDGLFGKASPMSDPFTYQQKFKNINNGFLFENGVNEDYVPVAEAGEGTQRNPVTNPSGRQKPEAESKVVNLERLLKEENGSGSTNFSSLKGKGLAMRGKSASRTALAYDSEPGWMNPIPVGLGDSIITDGLAGVCKSSSTPTFQDQDNSSSAGWPTSKWSLKQDLQAFSTAAITRPIFDGLPKPISGRKSKAALD